MAHNKRDQDSQVCPLGTRRLVIQFIIQPEVSKAVITVRTQSHQPHKHKTTSQDTWLKRQKIRFQNASLEEMLVSVQQAKSQQKLKGFFILTTVGWGYV